MSTTPDSTVASLNARLFELIATKPTARTELVDFHFKHTAGKYVEAIQAAPGRKILTFPESSKAAATAIRRAMIAADLVVFNVDSYLQPPALALLPISDDLASPVLGMMGMIEPGSGGKMLPIPVATWMYTAVLRHEVAAARSEPFEMLGVEWSAKEQPRWERTMFTRLADALVNDKGEKCHVVGGPIHVQIPREDGLLEEVEPLMRAGRIAFAPFACAAPEPMGITEGVLKSDILGSSFLVPPSAVAGSSTVVDSLLDLDIPYLEDISLPLLAKVLDDEGESLSMFRRKLDRALEDIATAKDAAEAFKRVLKLKRDELEDELERVRQVCDRVARMNSIARSGAYVAATALSVAGVYGLALPSVIAGCSAPVAAALKALWDAYETKREARRSSMYFVWRLSKTA